MRYLPHTSKEIGQMLETIGVEDVDQLFSAIPESVRLKRPLQIPSALSEIELRNHLRSISRKNAHGEDWAIFLGGGSYSHYIPSAVSYLLSRGEFLTAYTPYQPEVSQGTLQSIFEYQTMTAEILGMEVSNASHYDGSTATAEAALMAMDITEKKTILIARSLHPEYRETLKTYLQNSAVTVKEIPFTSEGTLDRQWLKKEINAETACIVVGLPNFFGIVEDLSDVAEVIHQAGGLFVTSSSEPLAFGIFKSPGEMDADIAVAEGQSFGNAMSFGGPTVGIFTTKKQYVRSMPGRLVGETVDAAGERGFVLTLATREQHIRREKASSNICTNVALCALASAITLSLWGKAGFEELGETNFNRANDLKDQISRIPGIQIPFSGTTFNEFVICTPKDPQKLVQELLKNKIIVGIPLTHWYPEIEGGLSLCLTEMNTDEQVEKLISELKRIL